MSLALFNGVSIEVILDGDNHPWFKRSHIGAFLGIQNMTTTTKKLGDEDMKNRSTLISEGAMYYIGPHEGEQDHDSFISTTGALYVIMNSRKETAKRLRHWILVEIVPRGLHKLVEEKQLAIEEQESALALLNDDLMQLDSALALLNDDLTERDAQIQQLVDENTILHRRAAEKLEDNSKNNSIVVIQKNNGDEYPYTAICGQQGYVAQKNKNKLIDYPNGQIVVLAGTPNAIIHYNWLRERGCIVVNPERARHFRLGVRYTHQKLMELQEA